MGASDGVQARAHLARAADDEARQHSRVVDRCECHGLPRRAAVSNPLGRMERRLWTGMRSVGIGYASQDPAHEGLNHFPAHVTTSAQLPAIEPASVVRTRLPNGLTVLIRRDGSAPVVAIVTYVSAGYFDETDDVVGIAHVLEHMYFKGTPTRGVGEIAKETKAVGGYLNAATIYDHTSYYTVLPASGFEQGLDVQADAYARSLIDAGELARELEVIIQEAKRKLDNPPAVATETLYELLHDKHRIRRWRIGREAGLRTLTRDAVAGFYRNFYHPGNTVLSIVGDVDPETALAE